MAKIKLAAIVDDMRNKVGNVVFSTGRGGNYIRRRVIPSNPKTTYQTAVRANLTSLAEGWASLTDGQRTQWNAAVSSWLKSDIFGAKRKPSGLNLYVGLNLNLLEAGQATISTPPLRSAVPALTSLVAAQVHAGATTLTFAATPVVAGNTLIVRATTALSAGRSFVKSQYRKVTAIAAGQTSPQTITTAYNAKFGGPGSAGQKVFFDCFYVNNTTGEAGGHVSAIAVVS